MLMLADRMAVWEGDVNLNQWRTASFVSWKRRDCCWRWRKRRDHLQSPD